MLDVKSIKTLGQFIAEAAQLFEDKTAFIWRPSFRALKFSYKDIYRMSQVVAHIIDERGLKAGDRAVIWTHNSPYWIAIFFGCQLKGVSVVPLAPQNTPEFVKKIADFTASKLIFKSHTLPAIEGPENIQVELFFRNWQRLSSTYSEVEVENEDLAEILFTSGTTGEPKGVELRHSNILANIASMRDLDIVSHRDHMLSFLPLSHIFEQVAGTMVPLSVGIPITQAARISGLHITLNMTEDQPTKMTAVPEFIKLVLQRVEEKAKATGEFKKLETLYRLAPRLPRGVKRYLAKKVLHNFGGKLDTIISGGAALDPEVGHKWEAFGVSVLQGYGATETSPVISANRYRDRKMDSVGPVIPGVEVKIAKDGEILVRGDNVVSGYYKNPKKTAEAFKDGWYHTDDIGFFDKEKHLHILGRKKYLIVTPAGENIYPDELEDKLKEFKDLNDAAVLGLEINDKFVIHAVLLPKLNKKVDPEKIIVELNKKLEPHQRIQDVSIWPETDFPRTLTKKIKKEIVIDWVKKTAAKDNLGETKPAANTSDPVINIISQLTNLPQSAITPDKKVVADLKMDSLARVTLVATIEEDLNVILDEAAITVDTTVEDIQKSVLDKNQKTERYPFKEWPLSPFIIFLRTILQTLIVWPFMFFIAKIKVEGRDHLDDLKGPAQYFINHISGIDSGFVMRALPRRLRRRSSIAAASDMLFENKDIKKWHGLLMFAVNIFPFSRYGQVKSSFEYAGRLIDRGFSILYHPEGKVTRNKKIQEFKKGTGLVAIEMKIPSVPVYISGSDDLLPIGTKKLNWGLRPLIKIKFGKPLYIKEGTSITDATALIENGVRDLAKQNGDTDYLISIPSPNEKKL